MKKLFKTMMVALMATAAVGLTGCKKDNPEPEQPTPGTNPTQETVDLTGTAWVGIYNDTYQGYAAVLTWSLDFTTSTEGELLFELMVAGQQQGNYDVPFTWTFDGTHGVMDAGQMGASEFTYNAETNTIEMRMMVEVEGGGETLGGVTTFYPRGSQPDPGQPSQGDSTSVQPGEVTDLFPANTRWTASEETIYPVPQLGDLPMTLTYNLYFKSDHTGNITITATVMDQPSDPQTVWYNWEFDNTTNEGNFVVQGAPLPFTYNPDDNTIHSNFAFNVQGTGQQVGGELTFTQVTGSKSVSGIRLVLD